jgi:hypothetical protein
MWCVLVTRVLQQHIINATFNLDACTRPAHHPTRQRSPAAASLAIADVVAAETGSRQRIQMQSDVEMSLGLLLATGVVHRTTGQCVIRHTVQEVRVWCTVSDS